MDDTNSKLIISYEYKLERRLQRLAKWIIANDVEGSFTTDNEIIAYLSVCLKKQRGEKQNENQT